MKRNSTAIVIAVLSSLSVIMALVLFLFAKNSNAYAPGEEYRVASIVFAFACLVDLLILVNRRQSRKKKYFKATRLATKEPDSIEYEEFKSEQRMYMWLLIIHVVLFIVFSLIEFIV